MLLTTGPELQVLELGLCLKLFPLFLHLTGRLVVLPFRQSLRFQLTKSLLFIIFFASRSQRWWHLSQVAQRSHKLTHVAHHAVQLFVNLSEVGLLVRLTC
jgi:hypothetical protein